MSGFWDDENIRRHLPRDEKLPAEIAMDPEVMDGLPVFRGTRIPVYVILEFLEAGHTPADILREYPTLNESQVRAAIHFGSILAACR
jgi:uncharacterized protein (DUF433 family)